MKNFSSILYLLAGALAALFLASRQPACAGPLADAATLSIQPASPPVVSVPAMEQNQTVVVFQAYLYNLDSQHQQQAAAGVKSLSYTIDAGTDGTITMANSTNFTSTISADGHSATLADPQGNDSPAVYLAAGILFATPGDKTVTCSGDLTFWDNSQLTANGAITVHVEDFELSADPASLTISLATESGAQSAITVTPYNGFTGDVSLSLSYLDSNGNEVAGAPAGISAAFDTNPVSITDTNSQPSTLYLCPCEPGVCPQPGGYNLVVTGTYTRPSDGSIVTRKTDIGLTTTMT